MSLPRLLLLVALGGLLGAVLVWGALALVYGPEVAMVLRVLFSAAVAGVVAAQADDPDPAAVDADYGPGVRAVVVGVDPASGPDRAGVVTFRGFDRHGAPVELRERVTADDVREAVRAAEAGEPSPELDRVIAVAMADADRITAEHYPAHVVVLSFDRHSATAALRARMVEAYQPLVNEAAARFAPGLPAPRLVFEDPDCEAAERWAAKALGLRWEDITARIVEAFEDAGSAACDFGLTSGMLAGDPFTGGRRKRPGQWGWRARMLRARRLDRAEQRREREWTRRAWGRQQAVLGGRKGRRAIERLLCLEGQARGLGIEPLPGEFTTALRDRVLRARIRACAPPGPTRADLAALTGGVVEVDHATATVRITMPAGTSAERCEEVRAEVSDRVPVYVAVEVVCATS